MALAQIDSLDGLSDALKAEYEEVTEEGAHKGKFRLKVESVAGLVLEDVGGLKSALAAEKASVSEKATELATLKTRYEGLDDPDAARDALKKVADGTANNADVETAVTSALRQAEDKHGKELEKERGRATLLSGEVSRLLVDATGTAAIAKHGGNAELLLPHLRSVVVVEEVKDDEGTRFVARIKNADGGNRITMKQGSTDPMGIDELVETDLKAKFPSAFSGSGASGGGGSGSDSDGGSGGVDTSKMSPVEKLRHARSKM